MADPVERMVKFVTDQRQKAAGVHAREVWTRKIPVLLPRVQEVVEVFQNGLHEPNLTLTVLVDVHRSLFPLVIAYEIRNTPGEDVPAEKEIGASALFRCEENGIVHGYRYPFHDMNKAVRPERFNDLGEPEAVQADQLAHAVADFLEWSAIGPGCGRRKLSFWSPPAANEPAQEKWQLRVLAA